MSHEEKIVDELESYFQTIGFETRRNVYRAYFEKRIFPDRHYFVLIDLVIKKDDQEIPIEVKYWFDTDSIHKGIGQALFYLIFYNESWLAVPYYAIELLKEILKQIKSQRFKVFDWQNKMLYEYHDKKIIANRM